MTVRLPYQEMMSALRLRRRFRRTVLGGFNQVLHEERGRATGETLEWSVRTNERFFR